MKAATKKLLIGILILFITYFHYGAGDYFYFLHVIHRELYFIPIVLAAYWFGKKGGLTIGTVCTILFLPKVFGVRATSSYELSNLLETPFYLFIGFLVGYIQDIRRGQWRMIADAARPFPSEFHSQTIHKILICIYASPIVGKIAPFVAENLTSRENISVSILGFVRAPSVKQFERAENYSQAKSDNEAAITRLVEDAREILLGAGISDDGITTDIIKVNKDSIASKVLAEQQRGSYGMVVVPGLKMSKAEEFILGNVAVKLVREIDCPVVTVF